MSGKQKNIKSVSCKNSRDIAVKVLLAFERDQHRIQKSLEEIFRIHQINPREKHLASELAYGSCRQMITLDYLIKKYSQRAVRHIDPLVRQILRIGLYQMIYLSRTPDFAAVNEAVLQAKKWADRGADKFVNAILRSVQRDIEGSVSQHEPHRMRSTIWRDEQTGCRFKHDFLSDPSTNPVKYYSLAYSHPQWLIERWLKRYDQQTVQAICRVNNSRPPLTLRINKLLCNSTTLAQHLDNENIKFLVAHQAIQLLDRAAPEQLPGFTEGWFSVQDITAMQAVEMLKPQAGERVLDLCAAPGGKTTQIAEWMDHNGEIVACDVSEEKLSRIKANCDRLKITMVQTCQEQELPPLLESKGLFDAVLVDAPCSNTGVMARRVEARHRLRPVHLNRLSRLQGELLHRAADMVKNEGRIVYSTCSIEPAENESLVRTFLQTHSHFKLENEKFYFPQGQSLPPSNGSSNGAEGEKPHYQLWQDGGYAVLLRRREK